MFCAILREFREILRMPVSLGGTLLIAVLMALVGPFGSYEFLGFVSRLAIWVGLMGGSFAVAAMVRAVLRVVFGLRDGMAATIVCAVAIAVVVTGPIWVITQALTRRVDGAGVAVAEIAGFAFLIALGFGILRNLLHPTRTAVVAGDDLGRDEPRLLRRLPPELRAPPLRLSVSDHYVEVATEAGAYRVLMRFSDAVEEMDGLLGLQVHRSHWVALDAVVGAERRGSRVEVLLRDGTRLPVSRARVSDVIAQGWLAERAAVQA